VNAVTDSTTNQVSEKPPPNVKITFRDDLDIESQPDVRRAVERSVATFAARMEEGVAYDRAAQAKRAKLEDALNAPLMKLIKEDPAASKTLEDLGSGQLIDIDSTMELSAEQPHTATNDGGTGLLRGPSTLPFYPLVNRTPPFDFTWTFFNGDPLQRLVLNPISGVVQLDARSGSLPSGASRFVEAYAGFGLVLPRFNHFMRALGLGVRVMTFRYKAAALGLGVNATTEGGTHLAAFEDGRMLNIVKDPNLWRARVSGFSETAQGGDDLIPVSAPVGIDFPMFPGHNYFLTVGAQVFADHHSVGGQAGAYSFIEGSVQQIFLGSPNSPF